MQFLALDARNGTQAQVLNFLAQAQITFPMLRLAGAVTALYAGPGRYDYVYVVGGDGTVVYRDLTSGFETTAVQSAVDAALEDLVATSTPSPVRDVARLVGPWPNPFNPRTALRIELPVDAGTVALTVFDARGRRIRALLEGARVPAGSFDVVWDGADDRGLPVPSGVYHFRLSADGVTTSSKGVLVR